MPTTHYTCPHCGGTVHLTRRHTSLEQARQIHEACCPGTVKR